jgi:hypothetical protein
MTTTDYVFLAIIYVLVAIVWVLFVSLDVAQDEHEGKSVAEVRKSARKALLAPLWPLAVLWFLGRRISVAVYWAWMLFWAVLCVAVGRKDSLDD